ncbi:response regulator transcription factor [Rhodanobacter sp. L36]|uniref:response regulator transcription factor n=1 Tax=Rhodanobacter sp. L36 TaxID=1747221 RepID=UPI00131B5E45|nr:response regulator transcription factor [Rhodanobacter sp. L36]
MPAESLRLLLIEDDALLRDRVLTPRLTQFGFEVMAIGHVAQMTQAIERRKPDIVLLDIGLPERDGFEIARTLRTQFADIGIVMLTGRSETTDRVRGLSEGADAYLSKPVEIDVLVATLHSVARRLRPSMPRAAAAGTWKLDSDDWLLIAPSGERVILSKTERRLLEELMKQPNQVVVRDMLIGAITDDVVAFDPHRLDSLIHRLRRKVLAAVGEPLPLNAVHGQGYLLEMS